jgi:restriction system protein
MTKPSGDGGIDIIATLGKPLIGGRMFVQCKRFAIGAPIGAPLVREFYGALTADRKAAKGVFITTSSFTDQAKSFARDLPIELIDREKLQALLDEYGL